MKSWKRALLGTTLLVGTTFVGIAPANAITCTITDPNLAGTSAGVSRGENSTTITLEPGAATVPVVDCSGI